MALPLIAGAGLGLGASIYGKLSSDSDREKAGQLIEQSLKDYEAMGIPGIEAQQLLLEELKSQGTLTPELEQMVTLGPSAVGGISTDPSYKTAQLKALDELTALGESGGMRLSDEAALEDTLSGIRQQERGSREAILANARERGALGAGATLASQLENQQSSAQNAYATGMDTAGKAQDRAFNAIIAGGELGGRIRGQEYGEKLDAARAADEISRFNTANQIGMGTRNVGAKNEAQRYNLGERQRISDTNVGTRNMQQQYNKGLLQKRFDNQLALNQAKAGARAGQASNLQKGADANQQMWGGIGQGATQLGTQIATSQQRQDEQDKYLAALKGR